MFLLFNQLDLFNLLLPQSSSSIYWLIMHSNLIQPVSFLFLSPPTLLVICSKIHKLTGITHIYLRARKHMPTHAATTATSTLTGVVTCAASSTRRFDSRVEPMMQSPLVDCFGSTATRTPAHRYPDLLAKCRSRWTWCSVIQPAERGVDGGLSEVVHVDCSEEECFVPKEPHESPTSRLCLGSGPLALRHHGVRWNLRLPNTSHSSSGTNARARQSRTP